MSDTGETTGQKGRSRLRDPRRPDLDSMYTINPDGSRNMIQTAEVRGRWTTLRNFTFAALVVLYLVLPWVTVAGHRESHPHDVVITRESPNYSV